MAQLWLPRGSTPWLSEQDRTTTVGPWGGRRAAHWLPPNSRAAAATRADPAGRFPPAAPGVHERRPVRILMENVGGRSSTVACEVVSENWSADLTAYGPADPRGGRGSRAARLPIREAGCGTRGSLRKTRGAGDREGQHVFRMQTEAKFAPSHLDLGP